MINRRKLLSSAGAASLLLFLPEWRNGNPFSPSVQFGGNPNTNITAIDVSGGIVIAQASATGQTPAMFQFSASAIACTGTVVGGSGSVNPYMDLEYSWNFGDASGTEIFTNPVTGKTVNANTDQQGPEAAYLYRSAAGSPYNVTLTVRGKQGSGFITATTTLAITVNAFAPVATYYVDSVNGLDTNNGTSSGTPFQTITKLETKMPSGATNIQFNFARGSHWTDAGYLPITGTGLRFAPYGTGAAPIIEVVALANRPCIYLSNYGNVACHDVVISGLDCRYSGSTGGNYAINCNGNGATSSAGILHDICLDNCIGRVTFDTTVQTDVFATNFLGAASNPLYYGSNYMSWNCSSYAPTYDTGITVASASWSGGTVTLTTTNPHGFSGTYGNVWLQNMVPLAYNATGQISATFSSTNTVTYSLASNPSTYISGGNLYNVLGKTRMGMSGDVFKWFSVIGGYVEGAGSLDTIHDHHIYVHCNGHQCMRWINMGIGPIRNYAINMEADSQSGSLELMNYWCIDSCNLYGVQRAHSGNSSANDPSVVQYYNFVCQNNAMSNLSGNGVLTWACVVEETLRNNFIWNCNGGNWFYPTIGTADTINVGAIANFRIYGNRVYYGANATNQMIALTGGTMSKAGGLQHTDNIYYDARSGSGPQTLAVIFADQVSAGNIIDRDQYYTPNMTGQPTGTYIRDNTTAKTLANLKSSGFEADPNTKYPAAANYGDPGWTVPIASYADFHI